MRRTRLGLDSVQQWVEAHGVQLNGVAISKSRSGFGWGIAATTKIKKERHTFITIPPELVINVDRIWGCSITDGHLREILEANGDFAKVCMGPDASADGLIRVLNRPQEEPS